MLKNNWVVAAEGVWLASQVRRRQCYVLFDSNERGKSLHAGRHLVIFFKAFFCLFIYS